MDRKAIGIDLGTVYSSVAVFQHGKVEVIANEQGNRRTPSYVAFTNSERLIGDAAKNQVASNPTNTIFDVQRLIGRKFDDPTVQADMKYWPFKVINDSRKPKFQVEYKYETKLFTPEEIISMILTKMKDIAEVYLGKKVSEVVITVPAYFNYSQRQAIKDACVIAGLNVLYIINGSTAAGLAYGFDKKFTIERNILSFDLGGGHLNASILAIEQGIFNVKSTVGDTYLGGEDFDNKMVAYYVQLFKHQYGKDLSQNKRGLRRLRTACESAKLILSSSSQASISIDALHENIHFDSTITRTDFEELNINLFRSTLTLVERALIDARMNKADIHEIVLMGGSTRIPKIQQLLQDFFNGKELTKSINPDEAVVYGAAIQAAIYTDDQSEKIKDLLLLDVTSSSLGIETAGGTMTVVIKRNTTIPTKQTKTFTTISNDQSSFDIRIFEGQRLMTRDNHLLESFELADISLVPHSEIEIEVTFDLNVNNILNVTVMEKKSRKEKTITITNDKVRLSKEEIERMITHAEQYKKEDEIERNRIETKNLLESYCFNIIKKLNDENSADKVHIDDKKKMIDAIENTLTWLEKNQLAENEEFAHKLRELETICSLTMMKFYPTEDNVGKISEKLFNDITEDKNFHSTTLSSNSGDELSNLSSRIFDIRNEHHHMLSPIEGYEDKPLFPLEDAIERLVEIIPKIKRNASIAKTRSTDVADGLTQDESAAIQLYTMEWHPNDQSLYMHINAALREENRDKITPYFCYLKLILTALWKLPSVKATVWRGIKEDLSAQYSIGKEFVWWGFSSCTGSLQLLERNKFLGKKGVRTLFSIECETGKRISAHSYYKTEDEILLLPATNMKVLGRIDSGNDLAIIHLREIQPLYPLLQPPFT
ncbi:unnamed protein product [Rotaria sp. Silwood2]|nr:unnamed protein product [Rotaria sp. Silwood2]